MAEYWRGEIAKLAEVNPETIRYYEQHGLLPVPERSEAGYRLYSEDVLKRLDFIKNAKWCGFSLKEIKKALQKSEARETPIRVEDFVDLIERKMRSIDAEIARKEETKARLAGLKENLLASDPHPGVRDVMKQLHMKESSVLPS